MCVKVNVRDRERVSEGVIVYENVLLLKVDCVFDVDADADFVHMSDLESVQVDVFVRHEVLVAVADWEDVVETDEDRVVDM